MLAFIEYGTPDVAPAHPTNAVARARVHGRLSRPVDILAPVFPETAAYSNRHRWAVSHVCILASAPDALRAPLARADLVFNESSLLFLLAYTQGCRLPVSRRPSSSRSLTSPGTASRGAPPCSCGKLPRPPWARQRPVSTPHPLPPASSRPHAAPPRASGTSSHPPAHAPGAPAQASAPCGSSTPSRGSALPTSPPRSNPKSTPPGAPGGGAPHLLLGAALARAAARAARRPAPESPLKPAGDVPRRAACHTGRSSGELGGTISRQSARSR